MTAIWKTPSPLGTIWLTGEGDALSGLHFEGQRHFCLPAAAEERRLPVLEQTELWLARYFEGRDPGFTPRLTPRGTAFQQAVWELLLTIPYGETRSYGELAALYAEGRGLRRMAAQALGGAVGRNPISLIIPCHRVLGADGKLTGYAGGNERKAALLALEGISLPRREERIDSACPIR